jgi:two-component system, LytTR family, sensor kinase
MDLESHRSIPAAQRDLQIRTLVLLVVVFWTYVSFITIAQWQLMRQALPQMQIVSAQMQTLQCILLFPILMGFTFISYRVGYDRRHWGRQLAVNIGLACLFGMCSRPSLMAARAILEHTSITDVFARMDGRSPASAIRLHASSALFDATQYVVLQGLIAGMTFYNRFRQEFALRETLTVQYERARLSALRMQINPHFLYNTLSAIAGLVRSNPQAAEGMVTRLGDLFRRALAERNTEWVTLEQELEYAESYLEIQRVRFADRLSYTIQSDDALKAMAIPPLLLQPLLENAVEHGLHETEGAVRIALVCRVDGERVEVLVRNISEGPSVAITAPHPRHGIGLRNVRDRLEAAFVDSSEFSFRSTGPGEYETVMRFPFRAHASPAAQQEAAA